MHRNHVGVTSHLRKMRLVPILVVLTLVLSAKWTISLTFDSLKEQCKERSGLDLLVTWVKAMIGLPDPKPPWWRPALCAWVHREPQGYVEAFLAILALLLLRSMSWKRQQKTRGRQARQLRRKDSPKPGKRHDVQTNRCTDLVRTKNMFDGYIQIEHGKPRGQDRYREILLGPVSVTFEAIRLVIMTYFKALGLEEKNLKVIREMRDSCTPGFLGISSKDLQFAVVLVPDQGVNVQVQRLGPARGLIREVAYQTFHVTYRGFVLRDEGTSLLYGSG